MKFKHTLIYMALFLLISCSPRNGLTVTRDKDGSKMLTGISDKNTLMTDKAFRWFKEGYDAYKPDTASVRVISGSVTLLHIEVWGGTWCGDTHELLPGFYKAMDAAGLSGDRITLHLVNRDKKTKDGSAARYGITNVPTFIVFRSDKELGRIVESAKTSVEADIAAMLAHKE